jgi:cytochrome c oxidase subunit 3
MASETHSSSAPGPSSSGGHSPVPPHHAPVSPGKVAMWLFLATEVMFFTGLIGSYIVLRAGSTHAGYTNLYPPTTSLAGLEETHGVLLKSAGENHEAVEHILHAKAGLSEEAAKKLVEESHHSKALINRLKPEKAAELLAELKSAGAEVEDEELVTHKWPAPYDELTNPLAINLTAANTFILICSSLTMVLALSAIQAGKKFKGSMLLLATVLIGSCFLSVQVYEYYQLMIGHHFPPGISATGHFRPSVSLFASCFFTMTGFHGAHVTGGVILLLVIFIRSFFFDAYSSTSYAPVELAGLYWHFVDLVWIILFTIVYLI